MKKLVIGSGGQIGSELTQKLKSTYTGDEVLHCDIREVATNDATFFVLDATDREAVERFLEKHAVDEVYVMAAILSAKAEKNPMQAWDLNMKIVFNFLEMAAKGYIRKVFWPSSIAVFGPHTPKKNTPQYTVMDPGTVYGISKLAGERWMEYYFTKYGVDTRSLRYPGIISWKVMPGGGTTDYAVEMFHYALKGQKYICYIAPDEELPMMYIDDAVDATLALMQADGGKLSVRSSYNIGAMHFTPRELEEKIKEYIPGFEVEYRPDFRQEIARSWPGSIDDTQARRDWGWEPRYDLDRMVKTMLSELQKHVYPEAEFIG